MPARSLNPEKITAAVQMLGRRIEERFPEAGLRKTVGELETIAASTAMTVAGFNAPIIWLRISNAALIILIVLGVAGTFYSLKVPDEFHFFDFVQVLEAGINDVVLIGAGIFFLTTLETRLKRNRVLRSIHELRSIAHVIDMQQLTKDPGKIGSGVSRTASSPMNNLTPFELSRYLDYSSEALALIGKVAALYGQNFHDAVVLAAVNEIEDLTSGISGKIWQKLMIVHQMKEISTESAV